MLELGRTLSIHCDTGPVVGPCPVLVRSQADHGFDGEAHARLCLTDGLVLCVMRHVGCAVEEGVDSVTTVGLDSAASSLLGMLFDDWAVFPEQGLGLCNLDGFVETLAGRLDDANRLRIG